MNDFANSRVSMAQSINRLIEKSKNARKGFTLVEMLIVVAILAVLMSIVFRLGKVGDQDNRRTTTVVRLQRIENCLSGYYAAFGSYPPVKTYGYRDVFHEVDEKTGDQVDDEDARDDGKLEWSRVKAACQSQPFGCEYPGDEEDNEIIEEWSEELKERASSEDYPAYSSDTNPYKEIYLSGFRGAEPGQLESYKTSSDWKVIKLFKFGMMSYLLPRYLFMMCGDEEFFGRSGSAAMSGDSDAWAQWSDSNDMPCDPYEGEAYQSWGDLREDAQTDMQGTSGNVNRKDLARVANIPSQAVCARWMPNLEDTCKTLRTMNFFGIDISAWVGLPLDDNYPPDPETHDEVGGAKIQPYKNVTVTVWDGWDREYYYYSPEPYQSYVVWSAGSNGKTFPPWMPVEKLKDKTMIKTAMEWKADDIMQMSH